MRTLFQLRLVTVGMLCLWGTGYCFAGDMHHLFGHRSDCGCNHPMPRPMPHPALHPMLHPMPHPEYLPPDIDCPCACAAAVSACCGAGGGLAHVGNFYGLSSAYGDVPDGPGPVGPYPDPYLTGYEGLPNMDGGGVHYRYPYHSYRRPWAHPGPLSTNVTIVW